MKALAEEKPHEWLPQKTAEVPLPLLEEASAPASARPLPRVLAQIASQTRSVRRLRVLMLVFLLLIAAELVVYLRLPDVTRLVLYQDPPSDYLVKP